MAGPTSITLNSLTLTMQDATPNQFGILFYASFATQAPFGDGFLCATGNQKRLPAILLNAAGGGVFDVDFTTTPTSTLQPLEQPKFQFWYRDPQLVGSGFNLSNALNLHLCP